LVAGRAVLTAGVARAIGAGGLAATAGGLAVGRAVLTAGALAEIGAGGLMGGLAVEIGAGGLVGAALMAIGGTVLGLSMFLTASAPKVEAAARKIPCKSGSGSCFLVAAISAPVPSAVIAGGTRFIGAGVSPEGAEVAGQRRLTCSNPAPAMVATPAAIKSCSVILFITMMCVTSP